MADPMGNSGIRADGLRPVATLKKENYRAWATKLKAQLKVMECWQTMIGVELQPAATAPAGADAAAITAALALRQSWDRRHERAAAVLVTSIADEELHTITSIDEDPIAIWTRLQEKFVRRSEAEAESSFMQFLDFTHTESETTNEMIERYETFMQNCLDQNVALDAKMRQRMLILRPAERYKFLKQNYLIAPVATKPTEEILKAHLRDIDLDFRRSDGAPMNKTGQGYRGEANWGQGSTSGGYKGHGKSSNGRGSDSDRGNYGDRGKSESGAGDTDITCYCCGQKGQMKPNCPRKEEKCNKCEKVGHLQDTCKFASENSSENDKEDETKINPEAGQFETFDGFMGEVIIDADHLEAKSG